MITLKTIYPSQILHILLAPFIVGLLTLSYMPGWSGIMVLFGLTYFVMFVLFSIYYNIRLQLEVILYFIWIAWSLTGIIVAVDQKLYLESLRTIFQMGTLIFIVAGIISINGKLNTVLIAIAIASGIIAMDSFLTGEFQLMTTDTELEPRAAGITGNANIFSHHLLYVIFAVAYFWTPKAAFRKRFLFLLIISFCTFAIIFSGSRQGLIGLLAFFVMWFLFTQGQRFKQNPIIVFSFLIVLTGIIYLLINFVLSYTYLGERLMSVEASDQSRMQMYVDGIDMVWQSPVFGVGLNNFRVLSATGKYSHSDYIEIASNTGIIGFFLYFSIYYVLYRRLRRIQKLQDDDRICYIVGVIKAMIITILVLGLTQPNMKSKLTWIFIAGLAGYLWYIEKNHSANYEKSASI